MDINPNKRLKEEFVSNLDGSSMFETAALTTVIAALVVLRQWSSPFLFGHFTARMDKVKKDDSVSCLPGFQVYATALCMDLWFVVLPILFVFTILADWTNLCAILLVFILVFCIILKREQSTHASLVKTSIVSYRVSIVVSTCLSILAVDFKIFPRRYAKTETYGTSLMDLGVGAFIVANALVSRQARNVASISWKAALQISSPLLLLGFGRLISTAGVDYQVHVGEYGVHWNFFFTLAAVSILTSVVNIHPKHCGAIGFLLLVVYQICLTNGLSDYLLSNQRDSNIISQNKEGFFSIFGYWGLYMMGVHLGYYLFFRKELLSDPGHLQWIRMRVWILCAVFWSLTIILDLYVERVSRRMCNLAYATFVLAHTFQAFSIFMLSDHFPGQKPMVLEQAYNQNLLASFLLANVLTGLVNLFMDTLNASSISALSILSMYAFVLSVAVGLAAFYGMRLKFW